MSERGGEKYVKIGILISNQTTKAEGLTDSLEMIIMKMLMNGVIQIIKINETEWKILFVAGHRQQQQHHLTTRSPATNGSVYLQTYQFRSDVI